MVFRLLVFLVLAYFFFRLLNLFRIRSRQQRNRHSHVQGKEAEEMILDPQCQSYLPKADAIVRGGHYFCSEECARLYLSR
ncbi:MAG: hypothetical protein E6J89_02325 [Deltaproteobacteria bacterium]|nr:MAG: hypothetical protein E6J89_02325 [Deltaproteobacteria bacterium]